MKSIIRQTYTNYKVYIMSDTPAGLKDSRQYPFIDIYIDGIEPKNYHWNLYCNHLMQYVTDGWFFFLDNDDHLATAHALENLVPHLHEPGGVITQFIRNGKPKPPTELIAQKQIIRGKIGGGSLVLHHSFKDVAKWDDRPGADFRWIKKIESRVPLKFVNLVLQVTGNSGLHGK